MRILVSGASGLIGRALMSGLAAAGDEPVALARRGTGRPEGVSWDPDTGEGPSDVLNGFEAVVHLAAENISEGRWTAEKKSRILRSRTDGTRRLATLMSGLSRPPKIFVSASAVGFYGDRGDETLDENAASGAGFLSDVCRQWEAATEPAAAAGLRVAFLRLGAVLDPSGGVIGKLRRPFSLGLGGPLGSGQQWFSWIAIDDAVAAVRHVLRQPDLAGPVNLTSPNPVTNGEFTATLARVLGRPAVVPLPRAMARAALGEVADAVLYASYRVRPEALLATGFRFQFPELEPALRHLLGRPASA